MYEFSIIIPHKNSFDLLCRCIASIPESDDIQVIVVDDNSDSSAVMKEDFLALLQARSNVRYIETKEGRGAGFARNVALKHAIGKWLIFADADDYFVDNAWDVLQRYKDSAYDIIYLGIVSVNSETLEPVNRKFTYNCLIENCDNVSENKINLLKLRHDVPWGKMIKRELVVNNNIQFDETRYCNDTMFSTKIGIQAKYIYADSTPFYCVTFRPGSLVTHCSLEADSIRYQVILRKNELLRESGYSRYQLPLTSYLRKFYRYGLLSFIKAISLGIRYKANFLIGFSRWPKIIYGRLFHKNISYNLTNI